MPCVDVIDVVGDGRAEVRWTVVGWQSRAASAALCPSRVIAPFTACVIRDSVPAGLALGASVQFSSTAVARRVWYTGSTQYLRIADPHVLDRKHLHLLRARRRRQQAGEGGVSGAQAGRLASREFRRARPTVAESPLRAATMASPTRPTP